MIYKYKSIKTLIAKVYRDLNLHEEDRWASMIEWSAEALALIGAHQQYEPKTVNIEVDGYKAALPCDFYTLQGITFNGVPILHATGSFDATSDCDDCIANKTSSQYVYTINDNYIFTNFDGIICISYMAIPTDEDGFPLIPDHASYFEACFRYIVLKLYYVDFITGKLAPGTYQALDRDWGHYCMQARGKGNMLNADKMESLKNSWLKLIPQINEHSYNFNELNQQERIKLGKR